jgi:hypothetical protein
MRKMDGDDAARLTEQLAAAVARAEQAEQERDSEREWGRGQADLLTAAATAADEAEARVSVLEEALRKIAEACQYPEIGSRGKAIRAGALAREALAAAAAPPETVPSPIPGVPYNATKALAAGVRIVIEGQGGGGGSGAASPAAAPPEPSAVELAMPCQEPERSALVDGADAAAPEAQKP